MLVPARTLYKRVRASPGTVKVAILGLDCVDPDLLFDELIDELPHLQRLLEGGIHGAIRSSEPPTTVPAWSVFAASKNPGRLGFTGFKNRRWREGSKGKTAGYDDAFIATSDAVEVDRLWDVVGDAGKRSIVIGVPQTFPPPEIEGALVSGMLAPETAEAWTSPQALAGEIEDAIGEVPLDVPAPGQLPADELLDTVREGTEKRFELARHLATTREWDLFFMVEMGPDRVHHALWSAIDETHPDHAPDDPRREALVDYYRQLDRHVGELVDAFPDDTAILVVSDHGAKACHGAIQLNTWLEQEGYLTLHETPDEGTVFDPALVDWSKTSAWAEGGYVGRLHLNVDGREPDGAIDPLDYEALRDEIRDKLEAMRGPGGEMLGTRVIKPQEVYAGDHADEAPDLLCYLGDLRYRAEDTLGHADVITPGGDSRHDEAVHDYNGVFILHDPDGRFSGEVDGMTLLDGAPTVLELLGVEVPEDMEGRVLRPDGGLHPHA